MDKEQEFLGKYKELCENYNLMIAACGCCDSPFVEELGSELEEHLDHLGLEKKIEFD